MVAEGDSRRPDNLSKAAGYFHVSTALESTDSCPACERSLVGDCLNAARSRDDIERGLGSASA